MPIVIDRKITGFAVRQPNQDAPVSAPAVPTLIDPDRRITLKPVRGLVHALRWPHRPDTPNGTPSWTSPWIKAHQGKFSVTVSYFENCIVHPFEVWVNGAEAPRGLTTLAKLLSFDMRVKDPVWLKRKLESLKGAGGDPITVTNPRDAQPLTVGSPIAALAAYVEHACSKVGYFDQASASPMLEALICDGEPKTSVDGNLAWYVDVRNPNTDDDFVVMVKEAVVEGRRVPISLWFTGSYPRAWDGLCKALSIDMQIADPEWIGAKLVSITDHVEPRGEFFGTDPQTGKGMLMPSTLAYVARVLLHRYQMLGILDADGHPTDQLSLFERWAQPPSDPVPTAPIGVECPNCHALAMHRLDGCMTCMECAHSKCQ